MPTEVHQITSRDQWLALRRKDVTASDVGAVLGVDPRKSPLQVHLAKAGLVPETAENMIMRRGRIMEPALWAALREHHPDWKVEHASIYVRDPDLRMGCTPDAFATAPGREGIGIVQGKTVAMNTYVAKWCGGDRSALANPDYVPSAPLEYQLQTMTEGMLNDTWCVLAVLAVGTFDYDFRLVPVGRSHVIEKKIKDGVAGFWRDVASGIAPRAMYDLDSQAVAALYPTDDGSTVNLTGDNELAVLVERYCELREQIADAGEEQVGIATALKDRLGPATTAVTAGGGKVTWKLQHKRSYTAPEWTGRVLRVTRAKP